jgi:hypothetical protein
VFLGDTQSWQIHLRAAQTLLPGLKKGCVRFLDSREPLSPSHKKAHQFFTGVIAWYDILSAATTGAKPWASRLCLDAEVGFINLEAVIGCENSVILSILEIAELSEWKTTSQNTGNFNVVELVDGARKIEKCLGEVLEQCAKFFELASGLRSSTRTEQLDDSTLPEAVRRRSETSAITRVFACAALVYLYVVVHGPLPDHPKIHESVSLSITALKELHNRAGLGMLAWPFCVAGCMATDWQMDFFRNISSDCERVSDVKSPNLKRTFLIMEECWRLRRDVAEERLGWQRAMESLNMKILLI